jgi:hypothetical protein
VFVQRAVRETRRISRAAEVLFALARPLADKWRRTATSLTQADGGRRSGYDWKAAFRKLEAARLDLALCT